MEWAAWKQSLCSGCGEPLADCMGDNGPDYEGYAVTCFACKARDEEQARFQESENPDLSGVKFGVRNLGEVTDG